MLSASLIREEIKVIDKYYGEALMIRIEFFASVSKYLSTIPNGLTKKRLTIFSNFDLTCSVANSSAVLVKLQISQSTFSKRSQAYIKKLKWENSYIEYTVRYQELIESIRKTGVSGKAGPVFLFYSLMSFIFCI